MRIREYIIAGLSLIITAITGQIENNILPMLFPQVEYQYAIDSGIAIGYGWPFPFRLKVWMFESYDWVTFIIDIVIIWFILFGLYSMLRKYKRRW